MREIEIDERQALAALYVMHRVRELHPIGYKSPGLQAMQSAVDRELRIEIERSGCAPFGIVVDEWSPGKFRGTPFAIPAVVNVVAVL